MFILDSVNSSNVTDYLSHFVSDKLWRTEIKFFCFRTWMCSAPQRTLYKRSRLTSNLLHFLLTRPRPDFLLGPWNSFYEISTVCLATVAASSSRWRTEHFCQTVIVKHFHWMLFVLYMCSAVNSTQLLLNTQQRKKNN